MDEGPGDRNHKKCFPKINIVSSPFFSIILPTYNRAHTLARCIDSIIRQTYSDWELIIVDDGSTDDTEALVRSYHDVRIKYVYQENQERSAARNHGIRLAQGEWLCFQDSDDEYLPEHLEILSDGIQSLHSSIDVVRSGVLFHDVNSEKLRKSNIQATNESDIFPWECFTSATFKRSILKDIKFDVRFFSSEDLHFLLLVSLKSDIGVLKGHTVIAYIEKLRGTNLKAKKNSIACLKDIMTWYSGEKKIYIQRRLCLDSLGLLKYSVVLGIIEGLKCFIKYPFDVINVIWFQVIRNE
jgi:glycosyltransferase involved in cell wall biosynthesis